MAPPRPTPDQEEELITTVAPTIKEEHEDTDAPGDFVSEYVTPESSSHLGGAFTESQIGTESTSATESVEKLTDSSVIEVSTLQPDVLLLDASPSTEPKFAEGQTEEAFPYTGITTSVTSDITDTPAESTEVTSEEEMSSTPSTSTSPADYIDTDNSFVEVKPPLRQEFASPIPSDITGTDFTTEETTTTETTFMCNTVPGSETTTETSSAATQTTTPMEAAETQATPEAATAAFVPIHSETSAEDAALSTSARVFDESSTQAPEHSDVTLTEKDTPTEMGTEFITSAPVSSAVATPRVTDEQSIQTTTVRQMHNVSGKIYQRYLKFVKLYLKYLSSMQRTIFKVKVGFLLVLMTLVHCS